MVLVAYHVTPVLGEAQFGYQTLFEGYLFKKTSNDVAEMSTLVNFK